MSSVTTVSSNGGAAVGGRGRGLEAMTGQDFLKLLISQLTNQDPMEPMKNDELMRQLSAIRELESNTTISSNFKHLLGHQELASASVLVGKMIVGVSTDGMLVEGIAERIRMDAAGIRLQIGGYEMTLSGVLAVENTGTDIKDPTSPTPSKVKGDIDGDGFVTAADRSLLIARMNGQDVPGDFKQFDLNNDGSLNETDLEIIETLMGDINGDGVMTATDRQLLVARIAGRDAAGSFKQYDLNGDGAIDQADLDAFDAIMTRRLESED